jgi:hypothetical protein
MLEGYLKEQAGEREKEREGGTIEGRKVEHAFGWKTWATMWTMGISSSGDNQPCSS